MIVHVSASREPQSFAEYVDELLTSLGETNSSAARKADISVSNISNWRRGATVPSIDRARQFADGMGIPRLTVMIKAGLLEPADVQIDPLYLDLAEIDSMAARISDGERRTLRAHVRLLVDGTRRRIEELQATRSTLKRKTS